MKSKQAADRNEQSSAGPKPKKRAAITTAARKKAKGSRCNTGERIQMLNANHTASTAPA